MRNALTALLIIIVITTSSHVFAGEADQYNTKVLLHGTKQISDSSSWQLSGWAIFPNIGNGPVLMVGGPRYEIKDQWSIECMAGTFTKDQAGELVIDIRASYDAFDPIHLWTNVEYFPKTRNWYTYLDVNYRIGNLGLVGIETENMHFPNAKDDLSIGPRVVLPLGQITIVWALQFHNGGNPKQIWARVILDL